MKKTGDALARDELRNTAIHTVADSLRELPAGCSAFITGSVSRGDFRTDAAGSIISDIDIVLFAPSYRQAVNLRSSANLYGRTIADALAVQTTISVGLQANLAVAAGSHYIQSIRSDTVIADPGNLWDLTQIAEPSRDGLRWAFQPVAYYLVKSLVTEPRMNMERARQYLGRERVTSYIGEVMFPALGASNTRRNLADAAIEGARRCEELMRAHLTQPLPSTICAIEGIRNGEPPDLLYRRVRDFAFFENHGLPDSFYVDSTPN